ncbi:MAG: Ada metal-binding domain-containing protein [Planctomycetota bacterium]
MKKATLLLAVTILSVSFCGSVLGELEWTQELVQVGTLIDKPNPTLIGVGNLRVIIVPPVVDPNSREAFWSEIDKKTQEKLKQGGFRLKGRTNLGIPELRITVDTLKLGDSGASVFSVRTSLGRQAVLEKGSRKRIKPDVWHIAGQLKIAGPKELGKEVTDTVLEQIDSFIVCHKLANPEGVKEIDPNSTSVRPKRPIDPRISEITSQYSYVASRSSKVFHSSDCRIVARIALKNIRGYKSRQEAVEAGKRPCKRCKP